MHTSAAEPAPLTIAGGCGELEPVAPTPIPLPLAPRAAVEVRSSAHRDPFVARWVAGLEGRLAPPAVQATAAERLDAVRRRVRARSC